MSGIVKSIFGIKNPPPAPAVEPPPAMPTPDELAVKNAQRRSVATQRARRGRLSTIFTEGDGLGG